MEGLSEPQAKEDLAQTLSQGTGQPVELAEAEGSSGMHFGASSFLFCWGLNDRETMTTEMDGCFFTQLSATFPLHGITLQSQEAYCKHFKGTKEDFNGPSVL